MSLLTFPNPVNDKAARSVGAGVFLLGCLALLTQSPWVTGVLAFGFLLRVAAGPRFSPLGRLATRVLAPRLGAPKLVPGPPKRFAQGIGLVLTASATALLLSSHPAIASVLLGFLLVASFLEAAAGFCLGCWLFGHLMRVGMIPASVCLSCANTAYET